MPENPTQPDKSAPKQPDPGTPQQPDTSAPKQPDIGHKALLEMHLSFSSEVDPNSEEVKTFLKAISDISKGKTVPPK